MRIAKLDDQVLRPLIEAAGAPFELHIGDFKAWVTKVAEVRNNQGVAHYQGLYNARATEHSITPINRELYLLLVCCLLRDCGFTDEMLSDAIEKFAGLPA